MEDKKYPCPHKLCAFRCLELETSAEVSESIQNVLVRNYFFLKNYVTSEGGFFEMFQTINSSSLLTT